MPGPVYNWFCVAHSILDVLSSAAAIRASQVYPRTASAAVQRNLRPKTAQPVNPNDAKGRDLGSLIKKSSSNALSSTVDAHTGAFRVYLLTFLTCPIATVGEPPSLEHPVQRLSNPPPKSTYSPTSPDNSPRLRVNEQIVQPAAFESAFLETTPSDIPSTADSILGDPKGELQFSPPMMDAFRPQSPSEVRKLTPSKIPSSKIGRLFHYGGRSLNL